MGKLTQGNPNAKATQPGLADTMRGARPEPHQERVQGLRRTAGGHYLAALEGLSERIRMDYPFITEEVIAEAMAPSNKAEFKHLGGFYHGGTALALAVVTVAANKNGLPLTIEDTKQYQKELRREYAYFVLKVAERTNVTLKQLPARVLVHELLRRLGEDYGLEDAATRILEQEFEANPRKIFSQLFWAGAAVYLARRESEYRTDAADIARAANTHSITVLDIARRIEGNVMSRAKGLQRGTSL